MNKATRIFLGIFIVISIVGLRLYKRYERSQWDAEQRRERQEFMNEASDFAIEKEREMQRQADSIQQYRQYDSIREVQRAEREAQLEETRRNIQRLEQEAAAKGQAE